MHRIGRITAWSGVALLALPSSAYAAGPAAGTDIVSIGVSLLGLIVAIVLLIEALGVRKVALGGAIAERISFVVLAIICLAASALAEWVGNFVVGVTADQVQLASQALVIAAMGLLAAYFWSVRTALQRYLKSMTGAEMLAEQSKADEADPDA